MKRGLYIHIPFCKSKCKYCDFVSFTGKDDWIESYIGALCLDIDKQCNIKKIDSIFIGGGTPSILEDKHLFNMGKSIKKLNKSKDIEFTIECNPGTLKESSLDIFKDMGINRVSLGLQSTDDNILKNIGRIHNWKDFLKSFYMLKQAGFNNINVDLMFGLPDQTLDIYKESLEKVVDLEATHISAYSLIIEEGTAFHEMFNKNKLNLPDEDTEREMYKLTKELLCKNGYNQYEISNYAKSGFECKHNLIYWDFDEYIGCGLNSSGFENGARYKKKSILDDYVGATLSGITNIEEYHTNLQKENIEEYILVGLRKIEGINCKDFKIRFGAEIDSIYSDVINKFEKLNLLKFDKKYMYLTEKGIEVSNAIISEFLM